MKEENKKENIRPSYTFTREDFVEFKKEAENLADKINIYLKGKDYLKENTSD